VVSHEHLIDPLGVEVDPVDGIGALDPMKWSAGVEVEVEGLLVVFQVDG
jgi:hypothetical protein